MGRETIQREVCSVLFLFYSNTFHRVPKRAHQFVMVPAPQTTEEILALKKKRTFRKFTYR